MSFPLLVFIVFLLKEAVKFGLSLLNYRHLGRSGISVPEEFKRIMDAGTMGKIRKYERERIKFILVASVLEDIAVAVFFFGGFLNIYNGWILSLNFSFIATGIVFALILMFISSLLAAPFDFYHVFTIERKLWIYYDDSCPMV